MQREELMDKAINAKLMAKTDAAAQMLQACQELAR
jgi:hypothetical protein